MIGLNIKMLADTIRSAIEGNTPVEVRFDLTFSRFTNQNSITDMIYAEFAKRKLEYNRYEHIDTFQRSATFEYDRTLIFWKKKRSEK